MSAIPIHDLLLQTLAQSPRKRDQKKVSASRLRLARLLVLRSLADMQNLRELEGELVEIVDAGKASRPAYEAAVAETYAHWLLRAEQLIRRVESLEKGNQRIAHSEKLRDEIGRVKARISISAEQLAAADEQIRKGLLVPGELLRHELQLRIRSKRR